MSPVPFALVRRELRLFDRWRTLYPFAEPGIAVVARFSGTDRMHAREHHDFVGVGQLHDFALGQKSARRLRARDHQVTKPRREAVSGIIAHRAGFGRSPERFRNALGSALVIGREAHPHMAIVENGIVLPVGLLDLIQ